MGVSFQGKQETVTHSLLFASDHVSTHLDDFQVVETKLLLHKWEFTKITSLKWSVLILDVSKDILQGGPDFSNYQMGFI